ncbi:endonuclease/exonuclease/phosphatase family protein [Deinococcus koreensis]|uniref:endonuclease/exonuclease/phosphatase family protein n=1 Tax=Deinococcus koreensis TaxID=2054903 RepID=UPI001FAEDD9A|nr:endonuclease/exonuclease/phosphatase family protein [Deinococcus koreensis]
MTPAWIYLLLVALTWGLGEVVGERTLPTLLLAYAPPLLWLLPAPLVVGWALWRRQGRRVALAGALLAAWGAGLLHGRPQAEGALRVVTYNVLQGRRATPEHLARQLASLNADVILLQESNFTRADFGEALQDGLPGYRAVLATEVTTLTRLPLLDSRRVALPRHHRDVLVTTLRWEGQPLTVVNAHLGTVQVVDALAGDFAYLRRTRDARTAQVRALEDIATSPHGPLLLGGDLNTPPRGPVYRQLRRAFGPDAHDLAGRGPGWTFPSLAVRIDHLLTRDLTPTRTRTLPWTLSDHRPLVVDYRRLESR